MHRKAVFIGSYPLQKKGDIFIGGKTQVRSSEQMCLPSLLYHKFLYFLMYLE